MLGVIYLHTIDPPIWHNNSVSFFNFRTYMWVVIYLRPMDPPMWHNNSDSFFYFQDLHVGFDLSAQCGTIIVSLCFQYIHVGCDILADL